METVVSEKKMISTNAKVTSKELQTVLVEIEATLNSSHLYPVEKSKSPRRPYHILCGSSLLAMPDQEEIEISLLKVEEGRGRAALLERLKDGLWIRWRKEYILELRNSQRLKMKDAESQTIAVGDSVVVYEDGQHRGLWKLGRVESLIEGKDGLVREAAVKSTTHKKRKPTRSSRPLQNLYLLELGTYLQEDSIADIPDVPTGTEHAVVWPTQGATCRADDPDVLTVAEDTEVLPDGQQHTEQTEKGD